jgi:hypothetical protein
MHVTSPDPQYTPQHTPEPPTSYMPGATAPMSRPVSPAPGGPPFAEQPWLYQGPPVVAKKDPPTDTSWIELEHKPGQRSHRTLIAVVVGLILAAVVGAVLTVVLGPPSLVKRYTPIGKDTGVAACEALRDKTVVSGGQAGGSQADGWARARKLFADSRYGDLRDSGTKVIDLMAQYDGLSSGGNETGAVLFMGSQIIQAYSALSGSCSAHGVNIPALGSN